MTETIDISEKREPVELYFAKTREGAVIPNKRFEDAGYDIYACIDEPYKIIRPNETVLIPTGIISAFSPAYYMQLHERGSLGVKGIAVRSGVIDSGYRGEWMVGVTNHNALPLIILSGKSGSLDMLYKETNLDSANAVLHPSTKAICQAVLLPVPRAVVTEKTPTEILGMASERGDGMLGSSGK